MFSAQRSQRIPPQPRAVTVPGDAVYPPQTASPPFLVSPPFQAGRSPLGPLGCFLRPFAPPLHWHGNTLYKALVSHTPILLALCALAAIAAASPAAAHAILVESTPAVRATVLPGALTIVLRFNSRIDAGRSKIILTAPPPAAPARLAITADALPDRLHANTNLTPGAYTLRWQVLATDGHITRGIVPFTVAPATPAAP